MTQFPQPVARRMPRLDQQGAILAAPARGGDSFGQILTSREPVDQHL